MSQRDGVAAVAASLHAEIADLRRKLALERQVGALLDNVAAFIAVARGEDHLIELVNEAFYAIVGDRDVIGRNARDALPDLIGQGFLEALDHVFRTGQEFSARAMPGRLIKVPGQSPVQVYLHIKCQPVVAADGATRGVFLHGVDVTEETIAQQRLQAQFHNLPLPTYVWERVTQGGTRTFALVDYNAAALKVTHGRIAQHRRALLEDFLPDNPDVREDFERCLGGGATFEREMDWRLRSTGETRRLVVTYAPALPDLVIVHTDDVTDRRKLEQQLRQAQKMEAVGRLAGGVAHDFNNILSVILSYCEIHLDEQDDEHPLRHEFEEIHKAGLRAVALTRQLLAFSRQQVLQPRVIDLNDAIRGLSSMLKRLLGEDIELELLLTEQPRGVSADPTQIEQVIMNLAINARDAMPTGGRLTIATANVELDDDLARSGNVRPGPYLMLVVSDTGVGMDEATRAQIFEPFFTTKGPDQGTGLGLATVFGIVHQSGGTISVNSEPGRGTTFRIYLPRTSRHAETMNIPLPVGLPVGGDETILLVEDDEALRSLARSILRRHGYNVLAAQNGGEALLASEQYPATIHLLLTDVVLPRMSGRQLAERLRPLRPGMKVLYMSGYTNDAVMLHGVLNPSVEFLQKPLTPDALLRKVRAMLDVPDDASPADRTC